MADRQVDSWEHAILDFCRVSLHYFIIILFNDTENFLREILIFFKKGILTMTEDASIIRSTLNAQRSTLNAIIIF